MPSRACEIRFPAISLSARFHALIPCPGRAARDAGRDGVVPHNRMAAPPDVDPEVDVVDPVLFDAMPVAGDGDPGRLFGDHPPAVAHREPAEHHLVARDRDDAADAATVED